MKKSRTLRNSSGTSLLELIVALFITSMVVYATYQAYQYLTTSGQREKKKAELQQDIITLSNLVERDIRMAGIGLPGNGLATASSENVISFSVFTNENGTATVLTEAGGQNDFNIVIDDVTGFEVGGWVCIAGDNVDTIYREIGNIINDDPSDPDTLVLTCRLISGPFNPNPDSTVVYPAIRLHYEATLTPEFTLSRSRNDLSLPIGSTIDTVALTTYRRDGDGNLVGSAVERASVVTVAFGGFIGEGDKRVVLADSTEVNIRNKD